MMPAFCWTVLKWVVSGYWVMRALAADAVDFEIELNGQVVADNCVVDSVQLDLGEHTTHVLNEEGRTPERDFEVKISNCPLASLTRRGIQVRFDGRADTEDPSTFHNEGTAENVLVVLSTVYRGTVKPGSTLSIPLREQDGSGSGRKKLLAWIERANEEKAKPGTVKATISMVLIYQ